MRAAGNFASTSLRGVALKSLGDSFLHRVARPILSGARNPLGIAGLLIATWTGKLVCVAAFFTGRTLLGVIIALLVLLMWVVVFLRGRKNIRRGCRYDGTF